MKYKFEIDMTPEETQELIQRLGMVWLEEWFKLFTWSGKK